MAYRELSESQASNPRRELEWGDLFALLWHARWAVLAITICCIGVGLVYLKLTPKLFRSQAAVIVVEQQGASGFLSQLGGLATLAGAGLGIGDPASESVAVLKSKDLIREYIARNDLLPILFADEWEEKSAQWKSMPADKVPDLRDGITLFETDVRAIGEDKKSGLITVSVTWKDPGLAKEWTEGLIRLANERLQIRALEQSQRNIQILRESLAVTDVASLQQALSRLLEAELQKELLAKGRVEFAFKVIDAPDVSKKPVSPKPVLVILFALIASFVMSLLYAVARGALRSANRPVQ